MSQQDAPRRRSADRAPAGPSPRGIACSLLLGLAAWSGLRDGLPETPPAHDRATVFQSLDRQQAAHLTSLTGEGTHTAETPLATRVLGEWRDHYRGERTLILRSDGTATMIVVLAGFAKKLFAERLTFDIEWSLDGGEISLKTMSGQPASKFEMIRKLYGDQATYKVLSVDGEQMRLLDGDGKTEYDWRRPETMYDEVAIDER